MTEPRRAFLALLLAACLGAAPAGAQALQKRIDARLAKAPLDRNLWGVVLLDPSGKQLYARNADRLFIPASNTKLVVSAVGAALLAPDLDGAHQRCTPTGRSRAACCGATSCSTAAATRR